MKQLSAKDYERIMKINRKIEIAQAVLYGVIVGMLILTATK
jgi:hypothetical protein